MSCWGDASIAVIDPRKPAQPSANIPVERHPTAMILNSPGTRLYVVNSDADSVSVIDTGTDREIERINVKLAENALVGSSPEGLALGADGATLYVANAHANAVAVVTLSANARFPAGTPADWDDRAKPSEDKDRSKVRGFIPTGQ